MTLEQKIGQMIMPSFRRWDYALEAALHAGEADHQGTRSPQIPETGASLPDNSRGRSQDPTAAGDYRKNLPDLDVLPESVAEAIAELNLGGIVLFAQNCRTAEKTLKLVRDMQNAAASSPCGLPLIIGVDQEGGNVTRLGDGCDFCGNGALGDRNDLSATEQTAFFIGEELACLGINLDFAPVSDVNSNPSNPVIGRRSFGKDPALCAAHTRAFVEGLHRAGVAATLKHFPGHGDTSQDSHLMLPCASNPESALRSCELVPFREGILAGADAVMTAHVQYPALDASTCYSPLLKKEIILPATMSEKILTGILRRELGFEGLIISDAMDMKAVSDTFLPMDAARLVINAGMDVILMPVNPVNPAELAELKHYIAGIASLVRNGQIPEKRIDEAVERILRFKQGSRVIQTPHSFEEALKRAAATVGSAVHREYENRLSC